MFKRNKGTEDSSGEIGLLGVDTHFQGSIRFSGTLRIDGKVEGKVTSEPGSGSVLVVHQQASVLGDIVSDSVLISGEVQGTVRAKRRVEIYASGMLKGDIYTADILIEGGAEFEGYCHMQNGTGAAETPPTAAETPPTAAETPPTAAAKEPAAADAPPAAAKELPAAAKELPAATTRTAAAKEPGVSAKQPRTEESSTAVRRKRTGARPPAEGSGEPAAS